MHASLPLTLRRSEQGGGRKPSACMEVKALRESQTHVILPLTLVIQSRGEERTFGLHWKSRRCVRILVMHAKMLLKLRRLSTGEDEQFRLAVGSDHLLGRKQSLRWKTASIITGLEV